MALPIIDPTMIQSIMNIKENIEEKKLEIENKTEFIKIKYNIFVQKINECISELEFYVNKVINATEKGMLGTVTWLKDKIRTCIDKITKLFDDAKEFIDRKIEKLKKMYAERIEKVKLKMVKSILMKVSTKVDYDSDEFKEFINNLLPTPELPIPEFNFSNSIPYVDQIYDMDFSFLNTDSANKNNFTIPKLPLMKIQSLQ